MSQIRILVVPPGESPYPKEIPHTLADLQCVVGGGIEALYPFDDPVGIVCNESGKLLNLPLNRALRDEAGQIYDIIAGVFFIVGLGNDDFVSLSDELLKKYTEVYKHPEQFIKMNSKVYAIPYPNTTAPE